MKTAQVLNCILFSIFIMLSTSCRKEEDPIFIEAPQEEALKANSNVAAILLRTAMNDGSNDNIIDKSNCFNVVLPVTVRANGMEIVVETEEDFDIIEDVFDALDDDMDTLEIIFPVVIVLSDFTEVTATSIEEFYTYSNTCNGENEYDHDIECIDIQYPFTASIFNSSNEVLNTISIGNDRDLYNFIHDLDEDDFVNINFPITLVLSDGSRQQVSSLTDLENSIENAIDSCDEDDDYDYNDDDCDNCTTNQLMDILVDCQDWIVDKLELNNYDLEDQYTGYEFNFMENGSISVTSYNNTYYGTWVSEGSGNSISVAIDIPELTDFNANWNLHEIEQNGSETKVDLRIGGEDRLRFESSCP